MVAKVSAWGKAIAHAILVPAALVALLPSPYGGFAAIGWILIVLALYDRVLAEKPAAAPFRKLVFAQTTLVVAVITLVLISL